MTWPRKAIAEVANLTYGYTESATERAVGPKFLRITDIQSDGVQWSTVPYCTIDDCEREKFELRSGDIVFARTGATTGKSYLIQAPPDAVFASYLIRLRVVTPDLHPPYLAHFFKTVEYWRAIASGTTGSAQGGFNASKLGSLQVPLPPLAEQKQIASILDAAESLRVKRRASLAVLDSLMQSLFLEMFGDPVANPKRWNECLFADVIDRLEGGKNIGPSESSSDYRILKVSAVTYGEYRPEEAKWLPADFYPPDSYLVRAGDLLISRANTVDLIGATAYVWETPARMVLPDKIWRFVWKEPAPVDSLYVFHMTRHKDFQRMIGSRASGTSGSMKNISKPKLLGLKIPLPPLPMQQEFAERVRRIRAQRATLVKQLSELESLFLSLQSQAFNGRLSTSVVSQPLSG